MMLKICLGLLLVSSIITDSDSVDSLPESSSSDPLDPQLDNLLLSAPEDLLLTTVLPTETNAGVGSEEGDSLAPPKSDNTNSTALPTEKSFSDLLVTPPMLDPTIDTVTGSDGLIDTSKNDEAPLDFTVLPNDDSCVAVCPVSEVDESGCFSDGNVYQNDCIAHCNNKEVVFDFSCTLLEGEDCKSKCQQTYANRECKKECKRIEEGFTIYCYRDVTLNVDECRAKCDGSDSLPVFDCYQIGFKFNCWSKCNNYIGTLFSSKCPQSSNSYVCGRDGLVYPSECHAALSSQLVVGPADGDSLEEQAKCAVAATAIVGGPLGKRGYVS